jgi:hypothetical protein
MGMRLGSLVVAIGLFSCRSWAPPSPPATIAGKYEGVHYPSSLGNNAYNSLVWIKQTDSSVVGIIHFTTLPARFMPRDGDIQGVLRDTTLDISVTYSDSCAGTATGTLYVHWSLTPPAWLITGTVTGEDKCWGPYTSKWRLLEFVRPD